MRIWAISDLHLSLANDKPMSVFGEHWCDHHQRIAVAWDSQVADQDLVLLPGDFSWANKPPEAETDFAWLAARPGAKVLIKGNHDHWWPHSRAKLQALLPPRTVAIKKTACRIAGIGIFGARGGDFAPLTRYGDERTPEQIEESLVKEERELAMSLEDLARLEADPALDGPGKGLRLCCFHYPPLPPNAESSRFTATISQANAAACVYGHLHGAGDEVVRFEGQIGPTRYRCVSCDLIGFAPVLIAEV